MTRAERILWALTALFLAAAGGAQRLGSALPSEAAPIDRYDDRPVALPPAVPADVQAIVDGNIFSPTRTAPAERYDPYGGAAEDAEPMFGEVFEDEAVTDDGGVPKLYGTVVGPDGGVALLRLDPALADARPYRVGDRAAGYRVLRIDTSSVVLSGPGGRIVLRLNRSEGSTS